MDVTRRHFLEAGMGTVTCLGFSLLKIPGLDKVCAAAEPETIAQIPVLWLATGSCTGCSVSLLNSASPTIAEALLDEILPGKHLALAFHSTIMAAAGEKAMQTLEKVVHDHAGGYVLVVDGATATKSDGRYCAVGEEDGQPITGYAQLCKLGRQAQVVLAAGACAAHGGIPAAQPNPTGCVPVQEVFRRENITTPVVNIPGCPPHPDWIVGSIATLLLGGLEALDLDQHGHPAAFFSQLIHDNCPYRGHYERGEFAEHFGEHGCLLKLGCKGPMIHADCPIRKFNNGTSWCCEAGHPCIGCCHPEFPFERSLFEPVQAAQLSFPAMYPSATDRGRRTHDADTYTTVGLIGLGAFLAGAGVTAIAEKLNADHAVEDDKG